MEYWTSLFEEDVEVEDYGVLPQKVENFKSVTDPGRTQIVFESDEFTQTVSKAMQSEYTMIINRIRQTLTIDAGTEPTIDDLVHYFL